MDNSAATLEPPRPLVVGAVAYDPKVVTIWDGFQAWFTGHGLPLDYVLFSNYERQVEALLDGVVDVAWNSPLAWERATRLAAASGRTLWAVAMRDTDRDLESVVVVPAGSALRSPEDLRGRVVGVGAVDSPQATLLPLERLRAAGLRPGSDVSVRYFDVLPGKHGDHVGGERDAARALAAGELDAACMSAGNLDLFVAEGVLGPDGVRVLARTAAYDHCNFTATDRTPGRALDRFRELLLGMDYADPALRELFDLEGLTRWRPGRESGYGALSAAVDAESFYSRDGRITAAGYAF